MAMEGKWETVSYVSMNDMYSGLDNTMLSMNDMYSGLDNTMLWLVCSDCALTN